MDTWHIAGPSWSIRNTVYTQEHLRKRETAVFFWTFIQYAFFPRIKSHLGNINSHFAFSPSAGSNVTRLLLASPFDYAGGLDKVWDYELLVYITDDNLLSGRTKAGALVETGTVTLSVKVIPLPTTIITTTPVVSPWGPGIPRHKPLKGILLGPFDPREVGVD